MILINVHVVEGNVPFLFGKDSGLKWEAELNMKEEALNMKIAKNVTKTFPCPTIGSHYKVKLHDLQEWNMPMTVNLVKEELPVHIVTSEKQENLV